MLKGAQKKTTTVTQQIIVGENNYISRHCLVVCFFLDNPNMMNHIAVFAENLLSVLKYAAERNK